MIGMNELKNGELWNDIEGNPIHAHGGHILKKDGYYYWYGEDRRGTIYVSCYRSKDLVNWEFRNHILTTDSKMEEYRVRTVCKLINEDGKKVNLERPKVLYNKSTNTFVLWAHYENGNDYTDAACAVATCDTPDGDFIYHGHFNPFGYMSRDCTLYQDKDDVAYFISAARDNGDLHVYRLSEDYLNIDKLVHRLWQGEYREAPAVVEKKGIYYLFSSFCTGWHPNQGKYASSKEIEEDWSSLQDFGDETTYHSQPSFILKTYENQFLYFGDRWNADHYFESGYVILPLTLEGESAEMSFYDFVQLDAGQQITFK